VVGSPILRQRPGFEPTSPERKRKDFLVDDCNGSLQRNAWADGTPELFRVAEVLQMRSLPESLAVRPAGQAPHTPSSLRECPGCGMFQLVPPLVPRTVARCSRCNTMLRRTGADPTTSAFALNVAACGMLVIGCTTTLMTVSKVGMFHSANLFSGPQGLRSHGLWELAVIVLFTTVAAPVLKLFLTLYVLVGMRMGTPPLHLRVVFAWVERLRPWSMVEVYLLGVAVAYVKLRALVDIEIGPALYALGALLVTMVAADASLDRQTVWEQIDRRAAPVSGLQHAATAAPYPTSRAIGCLTCGLVSLPPSSGPCECARCGSRLHAREHGSIARTWALTLAALILYVPANYYPVLTVEQLGAGSPSTILGGVQELMESGMYPLAALVFFASVAVPVLKLLGLMTLLVCTQTGRLGHLRDRAVLYRIVSAIGRWSMIDIFMESILVALVQFGTAVTIDPGIGAVAFAGVVIVTIFAAESFDPRLMWDAAEAAAGERK
jgi:paraquat-inducible protein A